ncbi:MAG: transcription elongation protein SprT [SAR116 cluster bacterium]|nr:transcription elongation protein SprT [SAR116 cluster bacterium]MEC7207797.1 SprT-like domain-containing protein [Pseudomonadota bacterium]
MSSAQQDSESVRQATEPKRRLQTVLDLAYRLLAQHGLDEWRISFDHARRRAGLCNFTTKTISLSRHYARQASVDHITDTILHEIAHALVGPRHGHNATWRQKAREIGCTAMRCHNLTFSAAKWMMMCPNGCFAVQRHRRKSGLVCAKCKQPVHFVPAEDYDQLSS